jgi:hypothetical protein
MANYYTRSATEIENVTEEELEWIESYFGSASSVVDEGEPPWFEPPRFEVTVPTENEEPPARSVVVHDGESCVPEDVCRFFQEFLAAFRPTQTQTVEFAFTCDAVRPFAFGGSTAFVTKDGYEFAPVGAWIEQQQRAFESGASVQGRSLLG